MELSLASSEQSVDRLLAARDARQDQLVRQMGKALRSLVVLSLNVPGRDKTPAGAQALFDDVLGELAEAFPGIVCLTQACDALGPYAILTADSDPVTAKTRCIGLEMQRPVARLVDLDVYSAAGVHIDRGRLGFPPRRCLVCKQAAVDCMRAKRHPTAEIVAKAHALLEHF